MLEQPGILGLFLAVAMLYTIADVWRGRAELFDERVTEHDRTRLQRLVIFVLLPLSVLLHEAGHALAVDAFGGEVVGFGFYIFYGYVEHAGRYTPRELALIALAGPLVNVVLGLAAAAVGWFRPPRPAIAYLLFVFAAFELGNALLFYPLLDALGGVAGDWETIYSRATPVLSIAAGIAHLTIVAGAVLLWKNARFQAGYAQRTGRRPAGPSLSPDQRRELAELLARSAEEATRGWKHPVQLVADAQAGGTQLVLRWESGGYSRALVVHAGQRDAALRIELHAAAQPHHPGAPPLRRPLARYSGAPTVEQLAPQLRRFLDFVDSWNAATQVSPS